MHVSVTNKNRSIRSGTPFLLVGGYVVSVIVYIESLTHPVAFVSFGWVPFPLSPVLPFVCAAIAILVCIRWQRRRIVCALLLGLASSIFIGMPFFRQHLAELRFELGRSAIERELIALCDGKSQSQQRKVGGATIGFEDRWIGTYYVMEAQADPELGYASVTTGGSGWGALFGYETHEFRYSNGTTHFGSWTPWGASR